MPWFTMPAVRPAPRQICIALFACLFALLVAAPAGDGRDPLRARADASPDAAAPALAGSLAYVSDGDLWLVRDGGGPTRLTQSGDVTAVRWSPGGSWLLLTRGGRQVAVRTDGSQSLEISGAWTPDDAAVAVAAPDGSIDLVSPTDAGTQRLVASDTNVSYVPVVWSPDGATLALSRRSLGAKGLPTSESVWLVQRDGHGLHELVAAGATWPRPLGWSPDGRWLAVAQGPAQLCVSCRADGERLDIVTADATRSYTMGPLLRPEWLTWAPDSSAAVASIGAGRETYRGKQLMALDLATGSLKAIDADPGVVQIQPSYSPSGIAIAYVRGPAVEGAPFTNLDPAHDYPGAIAARRIRLVATADGSARPLTSGGNWAEEAPRWTVPGVLLDVRWQDSGPLTAPHAQLWLTDTATGAAVELVDSLGMPASDVGFYGELGWSKRFDWHR